VSLSEDDAYDVILLSLKAQHATFPLGGYERGMRHGLLAVACDCAYSINEVHAAQLGDRPTCTRRAFYGKIQTQR
jgi:hypothetical protein